MKPLLLLACFCFLSAMAMAQTQPPPQMLTVKGVTIDSATNKPLGYVTVTLQDSTKKSVKAGLSKDDGSFELKAATGKTYELSVVSVGYQAKTIKLSGAGPEFDMGNIILGAASKQLKEVSVSAARPIMTQEVDRISYNVQADPESKALTALDMIRKVPLLSVDANDNIKMKGSANYKILINGRESALMAKDPSDVLKAMPADNIEKIEVITTPPAKYDAEGLAGIINIITKRNADQGYNAQVSGRMNSVFGPGMYLHGSAKEGKLGVSLFGGINQNNPFNAGFGNTENIYHGQSTDQTGYGRSSFHNHFGNAELSYEIDSLNLLTGSVELFHGTQDQNGSMFSNTFNPGGSLAQQYDQLSIGDNSFEGLDATINYQLGFKKKKDQLLTLSYKFSYSPNTLYNSDIFTQRLDLPFAEQANFLQNNQAGERSHTLQVDYAEPFKYITLEAGGKAILRTDYSNFQRSDQDSVSNQYALNPIYTDIFNYNQDVYSLYNSYQLKAGSWTGKAGLRLEHTSINGDFISVNTPINQSYSNLIPSVSIQRSFKTNSLTFGFTQRIQRPGIFQLNPFVDNSNPKFISTGNPNLRPELNNTFELNYSNLSKNSFTAGLSYQFSNNSIQNVTSLRQQNINGQPDTVTYTTFENLGSNSNLELNVNANITITPQLSFSINGNVSKVWLKGTYNGQFYTNTGYIGNAFGNIGYKFNNGYRVGIDAGFFSGNVNLQGSTSNFIYNSLVITKEFLNKKATISLVANDPEMKYQNFTSTTITPQYSYYSYNQNPYRTFAVRFSYKFGKLNSEIKKEQHGINNDDSKGGGKSGGGGGNG